MARFARVAAASVCALVALSASVAAASEPDLREARVTLADLPAGFREVRADEVTSTDVTELFQGTITSGVFAVADDSEVLLYAVGLVPAGARDEIVQGLADPLELFELPWSSSQVSQRDAHPLDTSGIGDHAGGVGIVDVAASSVTFRNLLGHEGTRAGSYVVFGLRGTYVFGVVLIHLGDGGPQADAAALARLLDGRVAAALGLPSGSAFRSEGTMSPEVAANIPTPTQISTRPAVIGANLLLAAAAVLALTVGVRLLNSTLAAHEEALERLIRPAALLGRWWSRADAQIARRHGRLVDVVRPAGVLAFYGLLFSFLEPGWRPWTWSGVFVLGVMTVAFGVVGTCDDLVRMHVARRRDLEARLEVKPALVTIAVGSVVLTKFAALVPGLMIGTPEAFSMQGDVTERDETRLAAVGLGATATLGLGAWAIAAPLAGLIDRGDGVTQQVLRGLVSLLVLVFAVAIENLFANLLALRGSEGAAIRRHTTLGWAALLLGVTALFFHTLINPRGDLAASLETTNVRVVLTTVLVFLLVTAAIRLVFGRRDARGTVAAVETTPVEPAAADATAEPSPEPAPAPIPAAPAPPVPAAFVAPAPTTRRRDHHRPPHDHHPLRTIRRTTAVVLVLALVGALTLVVLQHRRDTDRYRAAHAAYLDGRCDDSIRDFDVLLGSSRLADTTGRLTDAEAERHECADLLAVDALADTDPAAALLGYTTFLTDRPETPLRAVVVARAAGLVAARGAAAVASTASCAALDQMSATAVVTPPTTTEIQLECAVRWQDAGLTTKAYDAALDVLRSDADSALLERAGAVLLATPRSCADLDEIRTRTGLDRRPAELSMALQSCIADATARDEPGAAATFRLALVSALPDDPGSRAATAALLGDAASCTVLADAQGDPAVASQKAFIGDFTYWCAQVAEYSGDVDAAVVRYQWFLDHAPLDARADAARDGLARALIKQAEGANPGELPSPQPTGGSGTTTARVVVYNDSPKELRLVLSGPTSRIETIPASPTSSEYDLVGPFSCRTDVPSIELLLPAGTYRALVDTTSGDVRSFVGTWTLDAGDAYRSCFFIIVTSVG